MIVEYFIKMWFLFLPLSWFGSLEKYFCERFTRRRDLAQNTRNRTTHHFFINPKKTRLQKRGTRQEVTGVSVNEKTNVSRKYVKNLRALIHQIVLAKKLSTKKVNVARGKLNYLRMIKGANDSTYKTLCIKLNLALKGKHFTPKKEKVVC